MARNVPFIVADPITELWIATAGGLIAGVLALFGQTVVQWYIDNWSPWPYPATVRGLKPVTEIGGPVGWEFRVWVTNRTSLQAHFLAFPKYANGHPVTKFEITQAWDDDEVRGWLEVPQHDTREFRVTGIAPTPRFLPELLDLRGARSTLKVRRKVIKVDFTYEF